MKKTLLLVLALIAVGCAEPTPRNLDELVQQGEYPNEVYLDRETMRPYSGPVFQFAENFSLDLFEEDPSTFGLTVDTTRV